MLRNYSLLLAHGGINIPNARISYVKRTLGSGTFSLMVGVREDRNVECENVYYDDVSAKCFACGPVRAISLFRFASVCVHCVRTPRGRSKPDQQTSK